jgi:hypothetical protein
MLAGLNVVAAGGLDFTGFLLPRAVCAIST